MLSLRVFISVLHHGHQDATYVSHSTLERCFFPGEGVNFPRGCKRLLNVRHQTLEGSTTIAGVESAYQPP